MFVNEIIDRNVSAARQTATATARTLVRLFILGWASPLPLVILDRRSVHSARWLEVGWSAAMDLINDAFGFRADHACWCEA
jgi:hypothetical protein